MKKIIAIMAAALMLAGCPDRPSQPQVSTVHRPTLTVQTPPSIDPSCFVEGKGVLLPATCNELGAYPWCPAEDSPMHEGEPCFWRNGDGTLLWSDGINDERS